MERGPLALNRSIESIVYVVLFLASSYLFVFLAPSVGIGFGLMSRESAEGMGMLLLVAGWPMTLTLVGTTLLASLVMLGFGSWRQRLRVVTWHVTVGAFFGLAESARPASSLLAASVETLGLTLPFALVSYWLLSVNAPVVLWAVAISSFVLALTAVLALA